LYPVRSSMLQDCRPPERHGRADVRNVQEVKSPIPQPRLPKGGRSSEEKSSKCVSGSEPDPGYLRSNAVHADGQIEGKAVDQFHFLGKITDEIPGRATRTERALNVD